MESHLFLTIILADCTIGEEWASWGGCEPSNGVCGNGNRQRYKEELLHSRNGGSCVKNQKESENCTKDCTNTNTGKFLAAKTQLYKS